MPIEMEMKKVKAAEDIGFINFYADLYLKSERL